MRIDRLAADAYSKEKWIEAEALALEGLCMAESYPSNWNYGNVIHNSNQVLGLIRLQEGNKDEAIQKLLAAGRTPGSPQLNSFGPRMLLAKALLQEGEREAVLQYVDLVGQFWAQKSVQFPELGREHKRLIQHWKKDIEAGNLPQHKLWNY